MEKEIKLYLNYVKKLSYKDLVNEGLKHWESILVNAVNNKDTLSEINGKIETFIYRMYFFSIADTHCDDKEIEFVATISKNSKEAVEEAFDKIRVSYYNMNMSEKAELVDYMNQNTLKYFKTRDDIMSLLKIAALLIAVDGKVAYLEKTYLSNISDICKKY